MDPHSARRFPVPHAIGIAFFLGIGIYVLIFPSRTSAQPLPVTLDLFTGQTAHGSIADPTLSIQTHLGVITVPAEQVRVLTNRPLGGGTTLETCGGDILVGRLQNISLHFISTDGNATDPYSTAGGAPGATAQIPLDSIRQFSRPLEAPSTVPTVGILRPADRLVDLAGDTLSVSESDPIEFRTRWGVITLRPEQIGQIVYSGDGLTAQQIDLVDGSVISGFVTNESLTVTPRWPGAQPIKAAVGGLSKLVMGTTPPQPKGGGTIEMIGGDILRGSLQGTITLQTGFADVKVPGGDIELLAASLDLPDAASIDRSSASRLVGAVADEQVACRLDCGVALEVPAVMIQKYAKSPAAGTAPTSN